MEVNNFQQMRDYQGQLARYTCELIHQQGDRFYATARSLREQIDKDHQTTQQLQRDQRRMQHDVNAMVRHMHLHASDYNAEESSGKESSDDEA